MYIFLFVHVQVMSVPVVVTVHGNQQCDAEATIFWENAFSEKVCHIPEHIQLTSEKATGWSQLPRHKPQIVLNFHSLIFASIFATTTI